MASDRWRKASNLSPTGAAYNLGGKFSSKKYGYSDKDWKDKSSLERRAAKGRPGAVGRSMMVQAQKDLDAKPSEAEIRQATDAAATQAGQVAQAGAMEASQAAMGMGGAMQPGRAQQIASGYAEATTEAAAGASKNARELYNQIYESKRQAALDRMMQESQFRRQMRAQGGDKAVAAIPAVMAYNKFNNESRIYGRRIENFTKRFLSII